MCERYPVSNQQRNNSNAKLTGNIKRTPLKIGYSGTFRGIRTNVGPNQTGYDHMYATDKEERQPQQQQQAALSYATSGSGNTDCETITTVISDDHHFLKDFLLIHLDIIQQQNEEILKKDNIIFQIQQENAVLNQRLKILEQHNSNTNLTAIITHSLVPTAELQQDQHQATSGDYSPESIPSTEDIVAPDVGDDMTLADPVAPITGNIINSNNTIPSTTIGFRDSLQEPSDGSSGCLLPEVNVKQASEQLLPSLASVSNESSEVVIIEDDSRDADVRVRETVQLRTDLVENKDLRVAAIVERTLGNADIVTGRQPTPKTSPAPPTSDHIIATSATIGHALCSPNSIPTSISMISTEVTTVQATVAATTTTRYSVVRNSATSESGAEFNTKNLRMSIRRKRLCSGSSQSNSADTAPLEGDEAKGRNSLGVGLRKEGSRSKRKRLNGQILTFPKEYITRVGETNVDVLRHQALAEEVIKAANLEVPHWRVKVYADSFHLEGTENLDDEVFLKRHAKLESNERRRKRWDVQRIREQRLVEKLKQRQTKTHQLNADHTHSKITQSGGPDGRPDSLDGCDAPASLWPIPDQDLHYIEVTDQLPVAAFGAPLPAIVPTEFSLPWLNREKVRSVSGEVDTSSAVSVTTGPIVQNNHGRRSFGVRKSGRESGGSSKGRLRR